MYSIGTIKKNASIFRNLDKYHLIQVSQLELELTCQENYNQLLLFLAVTTAQSGQDRFNGKFERNLEINHQIKVIGFKLSST